MTTAHLGVAASVLEPTSERAWGMAEEQGTAHKSASLWQYLKVAVSVSLFILMLGLAVLAVAIPLATNSVPMTVLTSSMEPNYPPGTLIIVKPVEADDVRIGDVLTYQLRSGEPEVVTHRVISISTSTAGERSFVLQGDNNSAPDDPIKEIQIRGKLWYSLPLIGWVNTWVNGENRSWIAPAAAGVLFLYAGWMVVGGIRDRQRTKSDKPSGRRRAGTSA